MNDLEKVIKGMDFKYFGNGEHKVEVENFLSNSDAIFLDVRAKEEQETIKLSLTHHCKVLEIPTNEIPERINEIPKDKTIGVFCSAGVRATIIFVYLKSKGFKDVKIILGGYTPLMATIMPGKLYKKLNK